MILHTKIAEISTVKQLI